MANLQKTDAMIRQNTVAMRLMLLIFLIAGAMLASASVLVLTKGILGPLKTLTKSVRQISGGDLDLTVPVHSRDEVGQLAEAFNNVMAAALREYRKSDHARLLRIQQTTQLAIDSLPDAVAVFNPAGMIEISNRKACIHFGLQQDRVMGDIALPWLRRLFTEALETGKDFEPRGYQSAIQIFDAGEERFFLPRAIPMFDEHRAIIGVVLALVDVTRLRHADEAKSDLVSTVSHELKTPLTPTRLALHMLAQQTVGPLNPQQAKLVTAARDNTDRLYRIVENLLNISRVEYGRRALNFSAMAPAAIVEQALAPLRGDFERKNIALAVELPAGVPDVRADPTCVGHVLINLLSNALKFTPTHGHVEVSVQKQDEGVGFTVTDSGPGIAPEHMGHLFRKFFRAPIPNGPMGAGLGLSIAKEIVEAHGGHISFSTQVGQGSSFTFVLPRAEAP